jgi:hypothetical protein
MVASGAGWKPALLGTAPQTEGLLPHFISGISNSRGVIS